MTNHDQSGTLTKKMKAREAFEQTPISMTGRQSTANPTIRHTSFQQSWAEHRWEWVVSLAIGIAALILGTWVAEVLLRPRPAAFDVVFFEDRPLAWGHVVNCVGSKSPIDQDGRFPIQPPCTNGSWLFVYDSEGTFRGKARLVESPNGEFEPLQIGSLASQASLP